MTPEEFPGTWHEGMNISRIGVVTTIHLCDLGIEGTLESARAAFCPFTHLREFDVDGSHFTGPIPKWLAECFPHLKELDLSYGRLSGPIPDWVSQLGGGKLEQFKVEHNQLNGTLPGAFGAMPALRVLWAHHNNLAGSVPAQLARSQSLISLDLRFNARLCGALPPALRVPNWDWQWEHSTGVGQSWYGFCDKAASENTACGVLVSQGTRVGRACGSEPQGAGAQCGGPWEQCGGAPTPSLYKGAVVGYDVYKGPRCCTSDAQCVVKSGYFSQCVPLSVATSDHANDGATDLGLLPRPSEVCAASNRQCGGAPGLYNGPASCCESSLSCFKLVRTRRAALRCDVPRRGSACAGDDDRATRDLGAG